MQSQMSHVLQPNRLSAPLSCYGCRRCWPGIDELRSPTEPVAVCGQFHE